MYVNLLNIYFLALEFYQTKQINDINKMNKNSLDEMNCFSRDFPLNLKNNISTLNNFHKVKYEDIKNSSNKDEDKINNYKFNSIYINEQNKYINIKNNLLKNNINIINNESQKIVPKQNKVNHFNKTYKSNIYLKYYNDHQKDINNMILNERFKVDNKDNKEVEYINNIIKKESFDEELNDNIEYNKNNNSMGSDDNDEPDPRINFEQINQINKFRPLTSYGGLNARRKNLQSALQKNKINRPITSYNS